ncbi:cellulose synthase [Undibacterium sp. FT147W]|uniref:Cellulose synthase n=1 Tax=Undibacterium rivi TaxID=2828729 RepID=A0ABS5GZ27_9BURK|nr:cellulose synthase [Undibacterium rivi]MBR7791683.1 cellulose synthase [Undibacterium rivi]
MSVDSKHHVRIVGFKVIDFKNKVTGVPGQMKLAQCILTSESAEKGQQVVVGELLMPRHLNETPIGEYLAEFELSVGKDLRVTARLTHLHPFGQNATSVRPSSKEAEKKAA